VRSRQRIGRTVALAALTALAAVSLPAQRAAADAGTPDWPQSRLDARNTAAARLDATVNAPPRTWSFEGSHRVWNFLPGMTVWSSPVAAVVGDRAVVAVGSYDRNVYCLDAATGELIWKHTTGGGVYSPPTIWKDGERDILFAAATDRLVYALDAATGRQVWVHSVHTYRPTLGGAHLSSPTLGAVGDDPAVFVGYWVADATLLNNMQRGAMTALDARTGHKLWETKLGDNQITAPIYVRVDPESQPRTGPRAWLYAGSHSGTLYALDADTGAVVWRKAEHDAVRSPPAFAATPRGPIVVTSSKFGAVRGLDATTGAELWSYKTGDRVTGSPTVFEHADGLRVAIGSYDRHVHALDAQTGKRIWRYQARGGVYSSLAVVDRAREPLVLASAWDHTLHAFDLHTGKTRYQLYTGRPIWGVSGMDESNWASPIAARVGGKWMAYVGSYDGTLRGFVIDESVRGAAPPRSNLAFWLSFPIVLFPVGLLAVMLSRRDRQRRRRRRASHQNPAAKSGTAKNAR